ncbi:MAG TPA: prepilin-type N-terminal cleavage/methylation domain-containing protein [Planctomycetota bacterium]|nr:prepilin-type N-terminal cleavage/methylation domain-containing protein [Planctomycetota bacterium]
MRRDRGFTLIEMLVVIIIIVIIAGVSVALLGVFFRGQGVRQGSMIVSQVIAEAKQAAAKSHRVHYVVFSKTQTEAWMEIHRDNPTNLDGLYQGDQNSDSNDADPALPGGRVDLPKHVQFDYAPVWIAFTPSGYCYFSGGFKEIQASTFDAVMNGASPNPVGDIIIKIDLQPYYMCMDLDRASGKIRRTFFLNQEGP